MTWWHVCGQTSWHFKGVIKEGTLDICQFIVGLFVSPFSDLFSVCCSYWVRIKKLDAQRSEKTKTFLEYLWYSNTMTQFTFNIIIQSSVRLSAFNSSSPSAGPLNSNSNNLTISEEVFRRVKESQPPRATDWFQILKCQCSSALLQFRLRHIFLVKKMRKVLDFPAVFLNKGHSSFSHIFSPRVSTRCTGT